MKDQVKRRRYVMLIELTLPHGWSSSEIEADLQQRIPDLDPTVWGAIDGVDATYRKLRQLSREVESGASKADQMHSAHKALSFFRDIFPASFWRWKLIGGDHPDNTDRHMMAGR